MRIENGRIIRMNKTHYRFPTRLSVDFNQFFILFERSSGVIVKATTPIENQSKTEHILQRTYLPLIKGRFSEC
jgi:hypothetical protein